MNKEGLEALKHLCEQCHKNIQAQPSKGDFPHKECPWRHISNDYCDEYETVKKALKSKEELEKALETLFKYITIGNPFGNVHYIYLNDESEMIMPEDWEVLKEISL